MLPLWEPVLADYHPALVVRAPLEVALSLLRPHQTGLEHGLALRETHMARVLDHLHGRVVTDGPCETIVRPLDPKVEPIEGSAQHLASCFRSHLSPGRAPTSTSPEHLIGDAAKARRVLGWAPEVSFEELIQMMVDADLSLLAPRLARHG
jgi:hypothetical protein